MISAKGFWGLFAKSLLPSNIVSASFLEYLSFFFVSFIHLNADQGRIDLTCTGFQPCLKQRHRDLVCPPNTEDTGHRNECLGCTNSNIMGVSPDITSGSTNGSHSPETGWSRCEITADLGALKWTGEVTASCRSSLARPASLTWENWHVFSLFRLRRWTYVFVDEDPFRDVYKITGVAAVQQFCFFFFFFSSPTSELSSISKLQERETCPV